MLTFNVTFKCRPEMREEFLEMIMTEGIDVSARAEEGNLAYDFYRPVENDDDLLLIEKYVDQDAVMAHVRQPYIARLTELREKYVADVVMEKFEGGGPMTF